MTASAQVWGLVSGFPGEKRRNRLLAMFQAYLDESVSDGLFMMAGYVATAEKWAAFSDEWQRHLDYRSEHYRKLDVFHMRELLSERDKERIAWFYSVIEKYADAAIVLLIDTKAMRRVFDETQWPVKRSKLRMLRNPYYEAFHSVLTDLPKIQHQAGINSPIDFFFDESANKIKCLHGWEIMKKSAPKELLALMGQTPAFRNDEDVLPLQAADLWAGITRGWAEELLSSGKQEHTFPWPIRRVVPVISIFFDEERFRRRYRDLRQEMELRIARGGMFVDG
jgi:hypothetical protein